MIKQIIKSLFYIMLSVGIIEVSFGQINISAKQISPKQAILQESSLGSKLFEQKVPVTLSKEIFPKVEAYKVGQPLSYFRAIPDTLPLEVEYYFTESDSLVHVIIFNYERGKDEHPLARFKWIEEESHKIQSYNAIFNRVSEELRTVFGNPSKLDDQPYEVDPDSNHSYFRREGRWDTKNVHVYLYMIFGSATYRIRTILYWD